MRAIPVFLTALAACSGLRSRVSLRAVHAGQSHPRTPVHHVRYMAINHRHASRKRALVMAEDEPKPPPPPPPPMVEPAALTAKAYTVAGVATTLAWSACAFTAGARAQALAPLPLAVAVLCALNSAASVGWKRLQSATYRRLNLGFAASSAYLALAASFSSPLWVKVAATSSHAFAFGLCMWVWARSVPPAPRVGPYALRLLRGLSGSLWALAPKGGASDDPDAAQAKSGANEYALCTLGFGLCSLLDASAFSAWTYLAAAVCYVLKDAAERGRLDASTFTYLRRGILFASGAQCALALALGGISAIFVAHAFAVLAAATPPAAAAAK